MVAGELPPFIALDSHRALGSDVLSTNEGPLAPEQAVLLTNPLPPFPSVFLVRCKLYA